MSYSSEISFYYGKGLVNLVFEEIGMSHTPSYEADD